MTAKTRIPVVSFHSEICTCPICRNPLPAVLESYKDIEREGAYRHRQ